MSQAKVLIVSTADWAGSGYQACQAINSVGEFKCRHLTMYDHMFEYPQDILIRMFPQLNVRFMEELACEAAKNKNYGEAAEVLHEADIIHMWNVFPGEQNLMHIGLPIDYRKLKVITMTGSMYRKNHVRINGFLRSWKGLKVTVQDILFDFPNEITSVFIPHAIDFDFFRPSKERDKTIGTYKTSGKRTGTASDRDIAKLREIVPKFPGWQTDLDYSMPWKERMEKLRHCAIFVQDINPYIGVWGRSTLEACAYGIPCLENYSHQALLNAEGKLGEIPIIRINPDTVEEELRKLIEDEEYRKEVGQKSRKWIKQYFSYPIVGKKYSDVYGSLL